MIFNCVLPPLHVIYFFSISFYFHCVLIVYHAFDVVFLYIIIIIIIITVCIIQQWFISTHNPLYFYETCQPVHHTQN